MMTIANSFKTISLLISAFVLVFGLSACGHKGGGHHSEMVYGMIAYKLDFTDEQEAKLDQIRQQLELIREETHQQRLEKRDEMVAMIEADRLDTEKVMQLMQERKGAMLEYAPRIMPLIEELHSTLKPEQKQKLVDFMSKRFDR